MTGIPRTALELRSLITTKGDLELRLIEAPIPVPKDDEVLVRMEAAPLNPSDLGLMLGPADLTTLVASDGVVSARVPQRALRAVAGRVGQALPLGNEGAGLVVASGTDPTARRLEGKVVAVVGVGAYAQYRLVRALDVLELPDGTRAAEGASAFINPLTALGMVETMRGEGRTALVNTAAASNLGQMLNRLCRKDGVDLINIVRSEDQRDMLAAAGARHVLDLSQPGFMCDLVAALEATRATLAFDAVGGGKLASQILSAMEQAHVASAPYSLYGTPVHKQIYIYGALDPRPMELAGNFGMAWSVGGWLLWRFLHSIGPERAQQLKSRVAAEITTIFASTYAAEITLAQALDPETIIAFCRRQTGRKYLVTPAKDG